MLFKQEKISGSLNAFHGTTHFPSLYIFKGKQQKNIKLS